MKTSTKLAAAALLLALTHSQGAFAEAAVASTAIGASKTRGVVVTTPPAANGTGLYWSEGDQKNAIGTGTGSGFDVLTWTPDYRVALRRVAPGGGTAEMHEDKAQLYVV